MPCGRVLFSIILGTEKMTMRIPVISACCLAACLSALPASAQYAVRGASNRATGETYHLEVAGTLWNPKPDLAITSEALGIIGSRIDLVEDLGIEQSRFKQIKVVLRPAKKQKLRFEYTPIGYDATATLRRDIIFNGIKYPVSVPVQTSLTWKAYRFAYEWDMVYRDRGFFGLILEAKYTDIQATLVNAIDTQFARARAPIPSIGGIARVYVAPNISITGEVSGIKLPESIDENYRAKYVDFDLYGTVNFTDHAGAQIGYRSFDVLYKVDKDEGELQLKGIYFGGVIRY